jgi:hypothetical protein
MNVTYPISVSKIVSQKPHYLVNKISKQLIWNYVANILWKYVKLENKMPHKNLYNCIVVMY